MIDMRKVFIMVFFALVVLFWIQRSLFFSSGATIDETARNIFHEGVVLFKQGNFDGALRKFNTLRESGIKSGYLYYNIGSCFLKQRRLGKALVNYERARRYIRNDKEIEAAYNYTRSLLKRSDFLPSGTFERFVSKNFENFSFPQCIFIVIIIYYSIVVLLVLVRYFTGFNIFSITVLFLLLCFLTFAAAVTAVKRNFYKNGAVVVAKIDDVRIAPFFESRRRFPIYEGMRVYIIEELNNWMKIKLSDGRIGWVESKDIELIGI